MALIRRFGLSILPLLALALLVWSEEVPPELPRYIPQYDPGTDIIDAMHQTRPDADRLFSRLGSWELWCNDMIMDAQRRLENPTVRKYVQLGNPIYVNFHDVWVDEFAKAKRIYHIYPHQDATQDDLQALQALVAPCRVTVDPGDTFGYAHVNRDGSIVFGTNVMTDSGLCDRSVVLHEMTHWFQQRLRRTYSNGTEDFAHPAYELAAMIVESAEKLRQGYSPDDWECIDRMQVPYANDIAYAPFKFDPPIYPHMGGWLAYQQLAKYGPHFCGSMAVDLIILRDWVVRFETAGATVYSLLPPGIRGQYIEFARRDVERGTCSPLFSTAQTWLAINGARSFYPVQPIPWDTQVPETADVATLTRTKIWTDLSPETQTKCREFLDRCQGR